LSDHSRVVSIEEKLEKVHLIRTMHILVKEKERGHCDDDSRDQDYFDKTRAHNSLLYSTWKVKIVGRSFSSEMTTTILKKGH